MVATKRFLEFRLRAAARRAIETHYARLLQLKRFLRVRTRLRMLLVYQTGFLIRGFRILVQYFRILCWPFRKGNVGVSVFRLNSGTIVVGLPVSFDWNGFPKLIEKVARAHIGWDLISFDVRSRRDCPYISYWRHVLSTSDELKLNEAGRSSVDNWINALPSEVRDIFVPFHPSMVEMAFRLRALLHFATFEKNILILTAPENAIERLRKFANVKRWLPRSLASAKWNKSVPWNAQAIVCRLLESHLADYSGSDAGCIWSPQSVLPGQGPVCIGIVEDSGTNLNLTPGKIVFSQLNQTTAVRPVVLTSSAAVVHALRSAGVSAFRFPHAPWPGQAHSFAEQYLAVQSVLMHIDGNSSELTAGLFCDHVRSVLYSWMLFREGVLAAGKDIAKRFEVTAVVSINEQVSSAIALATGLHGIHWLAYSPVLLFNHPESKFFPAQTHLVYGDQLKELMEQQNIKRSTIKVVGSCTFDSAQARLGLYSTGCEFAKEQLPDWSGERIVVIGTENRTGQVKDIEVVLRHLASRNDLYIVIKLHPEDAAAPFDSLVRLYAAKNKIYVRKDIPLEPLLANCEFLICMRSNIIITAAVLGTPTLICDFSEGTTIIDFESEGIAKKCMSEQEIGEAIDEMLRPSSRLQARERISANIHRFNGPNDGRSVDRVVLAIVESCGAHEKSSTSMLAESRIG